MANVYDIGSCASKLNSGAIDVFEQDNASKDNFLGGLMFDLAEVPQRKPPENPLAPQWYKLEAKTGRGRVQGTLISQPGPVD
jgi:hypothetical protein